MGPSLKQFELNVANVNDVPLTLSADATLTIDIQGVGVHPDLLDSVTIMVYDTIGATPVW